MTLLRLCLSLIYFVGVNLCVRPLFEDFGQTRGSAPTGSENNYFYQINHFSTNKEICRMAFLL